MSTTIPKTLLRYQDKWIAFNKSRTKVLASGNSIRDVEKKLSKSKVKTIYVTHIFPKQLFYAPFINKNA